MAAERDPERDLRLHRHMERNKRKAVISALYDLRAEIDRVLSGVDRYDGLHDAADLDSLRRAWKQVDDACEDHRTWYGKMADLETEVAMRHWKDQTNDR